METHDIAHCEDCEVQKATTNGHQMELILPCQERNAYWACLTCDVIDKWPIVDDIKATNELIRSMMELHCVDKLVLP